MQLAVASAGVARSEALLAAVSRFERDATLQFEAGEVPRSVVAQATARRAQAEAGLAEAHGVRDIARSSLFQLTGLEIEAAALPTRLPPIPPDLESARTLLAGHPALAAANAQIDAARATITQAEGRAGPVAVGSVRAVHVRDEVLPGYRNDGVEAQVRVSVPLWDGGARRASVAVTRADLQAVEARRDGVMRLLEDGLRQAYVARSTAQSAVRAAAAGVEASRIALTSMEAEFRVGERPMNDVLDALADLAAAEAAHQAARAAFLLSHWQINAALGRETGTT
jgi:outer membrane protein TolC